MILGLASLLWVGTIWVLFFVPAYHITLWWLRGGVPFNVFEANFKVSTRLLFLYLGSAFYNGAFTMFIIASDYFGLDIT